MNLPALIAPTIAGLRRSPSFVSAVVATLALALGALICATVLANLILLEPLPYADHERLYLVKGTLKNRGTTVMSNVNSYPSAFAIQDGGPEFERAALLTFERVQYEAHPEQPLLTANFVSPEYFSLLTPPMRFGRGFGDTEKLGSQNPVAVISDQMWRRYFDGRNDIIGQSLELGGRSYTVVGVASERFDEPAFYSDEFTGADVWLPWDFHRGDERARNDWGAMVPSITVIAKLAPTYSSELTASSVSDRLNRAFLSNIAPAGVELPYSMNVELSSFNQVILGDSRGTALLLLAGSLTLLLIACSNILNLMLSRTVQKQKELTIRATLGATRLHLFQHILVENLVLMAGVALVAIGFALVGFELLRGMATHKLPRLGELSLGPAFVLADITISLLLALLFSALSIRVVQYDRLQSSIQSSGKGAGLQISGRTRSLLITAQVALIGLLIAANLSILDGALKTILRPFGYSSEHLSFVSLTYRSGDAAPEERNQITAEVLAALRADSRIQSAAAATSEPTRPSNGGPVTRQVDDANPANAMIFYTSEDYFDAMEQPLLSGRDFTPQEIRDRAQVAIISKALADKLYPQQVAIGRTVIHSANPQPYEIIGIVTTLSLPPAIVDVLGDAEMNAQQLYMPGYSVPNVVEFKYVVRYKPGQEVTPAQWRDLIKALNPKLKLWLVSDMAERRTELLASEITTARITVALTLISMVLAAIGIYGVLNYSTALRKFELGIRMSLGAGPSEIVRLVLLDNARPILWGLLCSGVLGVLTYGLVRQYSVAQVHLAWAPLFGAAALIMLVAIGSSYLPLHRLVRRWPSHALLTS